MNHSFTILFILLFLATNVNAQSTETEESVKKPSRWHFAVNAGTHYLRSHYNGYYYSYNPREANEGVADIEFKGTPGIWLGGNINYRLNENWFLSTEVALHNLRLAYKVNYLELDYGIISHEEYANAYAVTLKPISITRLFRLSSSWQISANLGGHLISKFYENIYIRGEKVNPPHLVVIEDEDFGFSLTGAGIVLETGITRTFNKGELSLLIIPTPWLTYTTGQFMLRPWIHLTGSGAIVKVQYAFK